jgi:hypothetical protein
MRKSCGDDVRSHTRTYEDQIVKALMVSGPAGVVVVRGPEVATYHNRLAQGPADLVRANGKEITSAFARSADLCLDLMILHFLGLSILLSFFPEG